MKKFIWLLLFAVIADLCYLATQVKDPFGYKFWIPFYLFLLFAAGLSLLAGVFLFARRRIVARLLGCLAWATALLFVTIFLAIAIDYRLILPGFPNHTPNTDDWVSDFSFLKEVLKQHPAFLDSLEESFFEKETLHYTNPDAALTECMRLTARIPDGHTFIHGFQPAIKARFFPLVGYWFTDGYFIVRAANRYGEFVGSKVVAINGVPLKDLFERTRVVMGGDNEWQEKFQFDQLIFSANVLHGLGIIPDTHSLSITLAEGNGKTITHSITSEPYFTWFFWALKPIDARETTPALMNLRQPNYLLHVDSTRKLASLSFHRIESKGDQSIRKLSEDLDTVLRQFRGKVVVDLRNNLGGNNQLNHYVVDVLARHQYTNTIYVLISRKTFSAAVNFISELKHKASVVLVGEPTGAGPNHYGDARHIWLPKTKISVYISTKKWILDSLSQRHAYVPDILVSYSFEDYQMGRDPWMEAVESNEQ